MKKNITFTLIAIALATASLSGCAKQEAAPSLVFEKSEYQIYSGEKVTLKGNPSGVTYSFVDNVISGIDLESATGKITYGNTIPNYTQVLYTAKMGTVVANPVVITLLHENEVPVLSFVETTEYICSGNYIYATSSTNSSITYKLKERVPGVKIDVSTGQVTFTETALEGSSFTVNISSNGASLDKTFKVAKEHLVKPINVRQATEAKNKAAVCFYLDFSDVDPSLTQTVTKLITGRHVFGSDSFVYDQAEHKLVVKASTLESFQTGENTLTIVTSRNMVNVTVIVADKIVKTPEDLVAINDSKQALAGYYILGNDIDLTEYLSPTGKGYNAGLGWNPIGIYHDVTDGTAFDDTFKGTFDGNGYTIKGYRINRRDTLGFNAGLFGYVYNLATIKNLGISSTENNKTASFAGALAGFNEGRIYNCWTDVNVSNNYDGNNYRIIGGFVGRNSGTIESCYSLGAVDGESQIGAFVGLNEGTIKNCYATKQGYQEFTTGLPAVDSTLFETKDDLIANKASMNLDEKYWDISGTGYPELKHELEFYYPYSVSIENTETELVKGQEIDLDVRIYPTTLSPMFMDKVVVTTDDTGCVVTGLKINTTNATKGEVTVTAKINEPGLDVESTKLFYLYEATESVVINNNFPNSSVEPGEKYILSAIVSPRGANQNVRWSIKEADKVGLTINGDELLVNEDVVNNVDKNFTLVGTSSGVSAELKLNIIVPNYLNAPMSVVFSDDTGDINFTLPNTVDLANAKMYLFKQECQFSASNNVVTVNKDILKDVKDTSVGFKLELANGNIYRLYASYISHNRLTVNNVGEDAIAINSVEDFEKYFNITKFGATKYAQYYDKTFYLTTDIDFGGRTIYGIGYTDENSGENRPFAGKIYGLGHTIKNAVMTDNEKYLTMTSSEKIDSHRVSRYGVGFFGALSGEVYDLYFDNIRIDANSWNGSFAGTMSASAVAENVSIYNSTVTNANGVDYSIESLVTGRFAATCEGKMVACSFNGSIAGLLGR